MNVKSSIVKIIGGALMILGCCALAFAYFLAGNVWGGQDNGAWFTMPELDRDLKYIMAISAVIGLAGIVSGWRIRRMKRGVNGDHRQKEVGN